MSCLVLGLFCDPSIFGNSLLLGLASFLRFGSVEPVVEEIAFLTK